MPRCRLVAYLGPRPSISLAFELENACPDEWHADVLEPVVPWDLRAWVNGRELTVRRPALDVPGRIRRVRLGPGERTELPSPIVLVFEEESGPDDDPFVWVLATTPPPPTVELEATVTAGGEKLPTGRTIVTLAGG
jgi:hypothetical protein